MARRRRKKQDGILDRELSLETLMLLLGYIILFFTAAGIVIGLVSFALTMPVVAFERFGLLPFVLIFAVIVGLFILRSKWFKQRQAKSSRRQRYKNSLNNASVDSLLEDYGEAPYEFEQYIACLFYDLGYQNVTVTPPINDRGKDIVMYRDGRKYVVEVKLYAPHNHIGREKIQKLHSAMIDSEAGGAIFVTTSDFTENAIEYAKKFNIELINGAGLEEILNRINDKRQQRAFERKKRFLAIVSVCKNAVMKMGDKLKKSWWGD